MSGANPRRQSVRRQPTAPKCPAPTLGAKVSGANPRRQSVRRQPAAPKCPAPTRGAKVSGAKTARRQNGVAKTAVQKRRRQNGVAKTAAAKRASPGPKMIFFSIFHLADWKKCVSIWEHNVCKISAVYPKIDRRAVF